MIFNPPDQLTPKQFELLSYVLIKSFERQGGGETKARFATEAHRVTWSPNAFLGRSPTKVEASALSRQLSKLVKGGLLDKNERFVTLTNNGKRALREHALKHENRGLFRTVRLFIELATNSEHQSALETATRLAREQGKTELAEGLFTLRMGELKHLGEILKQLEADKAIY